MLNHVLKQYLLITDRTVLLFKKYVYTINHKKIALNYLYFSFITGLSGLSLATMIRFELATPGSHFFKGDSIKYLQVITTHGLIMIFFVVIPIIFGFFANFFIPYHIGSKDVAFPRLNSIGFWLQPAAFFLLAKMAFLRPQITKTYDSIASYSAYNSSLSKPVELGVIKLLNPLLNRINHATTESIQNEITSKYAQQVQTHLLTRSEVIGFGNTQNRLQNLLYYINVNNLKVKKNLCFVKCSSSNYVLPGWTFITPFSSNIKYSGVGSQDIAIIGVLLAGVSTTISFTNLLITRRTLSMPGIRNRKTILPFLTIALFLVMRMLTLITPVLGAAMIMLLSDRHLKTSFFDYSYGGDVILFNHLFWFFGHPEVYVVIIPAFGIINNILPFYINRRVASKNHLIWATYIMAYMGFLVWGHHMYLVGLDHRSRSLYSTITIMISLPAVIKISNWTLTLLNGTCSFGIPVLFSISFILFFLSGGLTGMWLSHIGLNLYTHDTFYVVAHFHFMFSCSVFSAIFAAIYHYFTLIFNCTYSKIFAYTHLFYWFFGQWLTFLPLYIVGYNGLPRRYHDYPTVFLGWHSLSTAGHTLNILSVFFFFIMLLDSKIQNKQKPLGSLGFARVYNRFSYVLYKIKFNRSINA